MGECSVEYTVSLGSEVLASAPSIFRLTVFVKAWYNMCTDNHEFVLTNTRTGKSQSFSLNDVNESEAQTAVALGWIVNVN